MVKENLSLAGGVIMGLSWNKMQQMLKGVWQLGSQAMDHFQELVVMQLEYLLLKTQTAICSRVYALNQLLQYTCIFGFHLKEYQEW